MVRYFRDESHRLRVIPDKLTLSAQVLQQRVNPARIPVRKGELGQYMTDDQKRSGIHYLDLSIGERYKLLRKAITEKGASTVLRMLNAQIILRKNNTNNPKIAKTRRIFEQDAKWVRKYFIK